MKFWHHFDVKAPVAVVAAFHEHAASMPAITPPPLNVRLEEAPEKLGEGDEMSFRVGLGPFSVLWRARIEQTSASGFVDRQLRGPFRRWTHRHSYRVTAGGATEVVDEVVAELRRHPLWGPVGFAMWLGMPALFAYRASQTRRLLEKPGNWRDRPRKAA